MPFGTEPFPGPSQLHSSIWVMFSFPEASLGVLFLKGEVLPLAPLRVHGAGYVEIFNTHLCGFGETGEVV